jgi:hypothetical protein
LGGFDHAARDFAPPCPLHALLGKGARGAYRSISHREDPDLGARTRKFIGLIGILAFLAAYVAVATSIADRLPDNRLVELAYFVIAGTFWFIPILPLIYWMNRGK